MTASVGLSPAGRSAGGDDDLLNNLPSDSDDDDDDDDNDDGSLEFMFCDEPGHVPTAFQLSVSPSSG